MLDQIKKFINPSQNSSLILAGNYQSKHLPTLWLLGKTGAGKTSLIKSIAGLDELIIGNGFMPCTPTSTAYEYPRDKPIMRFLDTRGLAEANYDPSADISELEKSAHALIVIMKADDPEQSAVLSVLTKLKHKLKHLIVIHSAVLQLSPDDRERHQRFNEAQLSKVWGSEFISVGVDFDTGNGTVYNFDEMICAISTELPVVGLMLHDQEHRSIEAQNFHRLKKEILWYCGCASASDLVPLVGIVSVPSIQAKMLQSLANQYGVVWNKKTFTEFIASIGGSFALQYSSKHGLRQLMKIIPGYGQTVGAVAASTLSFASSYALARAACYYFYNKSKNQPVSQKALQAMFYEGLKQSKQVGGDDKT
ncbi:kinase [Alginatibacterium sediminis]|uniref:Kinase n=1 Tax=Alginatibacterium sediminis TaxID=2164068 RepID=A0A420EHB9_9ALTE|nr:GTPase [Alginatibacterium sediminis]RKF20054.1 kinase [Alginatibacterium sediminis]